MATTEEDIKRFEELVKKFEEAARRERMKHQPERSRLLKQRDAIDERLHKLEHDAIMRALKAVTST